MDNYYDVLQLRPTATEFEIKAAHRKLVKKYHPDRNPNLNARTLFLKVQEAYEVLSDPKKRSIYDFHLQKIDRISTTPPPVYDTAEKANPYADYRQQYKKTRAENDLEHQQKLWKVKQKVFRFQKIISIPFILLCFVLLIDGSIAPNLRTEKIETIASKKNKREVMIEISSENGLFKISSYYARQIKIHDLITFNESKIFGMNSFVVLNKNNTKIKISNLFLNPPIPFLPLLFLIFSLIPFSSRSYNGVLLSCQYTSFFFASFNVVLLLRYI